MYYYKLFKNLFNHFFVISFMNFYESNLCNIYLHTDTKHILQINLVLLRFMFEEHILHNKLYIIIFSNIFF